MKLYLISRSGVIGGDAYDMAVVAAESEEDARRIHPASSEFVERANVWKLLARACVWPSYSDRDSIKVQYLGDTTLCRGVICASFIEA